MHISWNGAKKKYPHNNTFVFGQIIIMRLVQSMYDDKSFFFLLTLQLESSDVAPKSFIIGVIGVERRKLFHNIEIFFL
jgi:hypothetical protein